MFNNLCHLFTFNTGPQNYYQRWFKHDIIPSYALYDNNWIHNIYNYNNLQFCLRRLAVDKMATNIWRYFTLRMRDYHWHVSIRLANIYSILSSINIYPLLNTVLKIIDKINIKLFRRLRCTRIIIKRVTFNLHK